MVAGQHRVPRSRRQARRVTAVVSCKAYGARRRLYYWCRGSRQTSVTRVVWMPFSPEQRQRVIEAIKSRRLRLDPPTSMYAGYGTGRTCDGCGEVIDQTQVEYECVYQDGFSSFLHLGCAGLLDAEQRRVVHIQQAREHARELRDQAQAARRDARVTAKDSAQLRDRADVLAREAEVMVGRTRDVKRGAAP